MILSRTFANTRALTYTEVGYIRLIAARIHAPYTGVRHVTLRTPHTAHRAIRVIVYVDILYRKTYSFGKIDKLYRIYIGYYSSNICIYIC